MRTRRFGCALLALLLLLALPQSMLLAQPADGSGDAATISIDQKIADLEKQLAALRAEVATMKGSSTTSAAPAAPVAVGNNAVPAADGAAPAAAPAAPANPLAGLSSVLNGATVNGLVDTYYGYNFNQPATRSSGLRLFDNATNQFALNLIEFGLVKTPTADSRLGYNLTFGFGNAMNVVNSSDPGGLGFAQYLKEGYVSYLAPVGKGLQVDFGKFVTPVGAEVIESNQNWNYSRSLLFNYAIPFYHFGMRAKYTFNDKYSLTAFVVNGWNNLVDNYSSGKTGGLSFAWTPNKKVSVTETWLGGPGAVPADGNNWRNLADTVVTYSPNAKLSFMANGDYGRTEGFAGSNQPAEWYGGAGYIKYQFDPRYAIATRYEYYNDPDGVTTGSFLPDGVFVPTRQHIQEVTGTVERRIAQHLITRLEFRHDLANQPAFLKSTTPVLGQSTIAGGLMFVLEPGESK